jgi:hypothetical protein
VFSLSCRFAFPPTPYHSISLCCNLIRWHRIISFRLCNWPPRYLVFVRSLAIICASPVVTWVSVPRLCMFDAGTRVPTCDVWRCGSATGFLFSPITQCVVFSKTKSRARNRPKLPSRKSLPRSPMGHLTFWQNQAMLPTVGGVFSFGIEA